MSIKSISYSIGIRKIENNKTLIDDKNCLANFSFFKNTAFHWLADPFLISHNNHVYVLAEKCNRLTLKGHIVYKDITTPNSKWQKCLADKYHLSFPAVRFEEDHFLLMPESHKRKAIRLYKSNSLDFSNASFETLLSGHSFVDSVYVRVENDDMLITYIDNSFGEKPELKLYKGQDNTYSLIGSIFDENLKYRPAGYPFRYKQKLILPTQDCAKNYGGGVILNDVSTKPFAVKPIFEITSDDCNKILSKTNVVGIHTYNSAGGYETIDILSEEFHFWGLLEKIFRKFKSLFQRKKPLK